jgi:hypothetical protein
MRAPPDEHQDLHFGSDDDSEEEASPTPGPPGGFPDRAQTASNVYY